MGEIAPEEQFLPLSTIFYYMMLDFYVKTGIRFSLRDKRLSEVTEVEITRVDCSYFVIFPVFLSYLEYRKLSKFAVLFTVIVGLEITSISFLSEKITLT